MDSCTHIDKVQLVSGLKALLGEHFCEDALEVKYSSQRIEYTNIIESLVLKIAVRTIYFRKEEQTN